MQKPDGAVVIKEFLPPRSAGIPPGGSADSTSDGSEESSKGMNSAITCALFDDGTIRGIPAHVEMMTQLRAGREFQMKRLLPLLTAIQEREDRDWYSAVRDVIVSVSAMDITMPGGRKAEGLFANGMRSANTLTLNGLRSSDRAFQQNGVGGGRQQLDAAIAEHRALQEYLLPRRTDEHHLLFPKIASARANLAVSFSIGCCTGGTGSRGILHSNVRTREYANSDGMRPTREFASDLLTKTSNWLVTFPDGAQRTESNSATAFANRCFGQENLSSSDSVGPAHPDAGSTRRGDCPRDPHASEG